MVRKWTAVVVIIGLTAMLGSAETVRIDPDTLPLSGWTYENFGTEADYELVVGPDTAPLGCGSLAFSHAGPPGANGGTFHTSNFNGTYLDDITALGYSSYQEGAPSTALYQPPYLALMLDLDDDGTFDNRLYFEPSFQNGGRPMTPTVNGVTLAPANTVNVVQNGLDTTGASVAPNTWWTWDCLIGSWWQIPNPGQPDLLAGDVGVGGPPLVTVAGLLEGWPDAVIVDQEGNAINTGGLRLQYGFGGNSDEYIGHVDALVFNTVAGETTVDFEAPAPSITCPPDLVFECPTPPESLIPESNPSLPLPVVDTGGIEDFTLTYSDDLVLGDCVGEYTILRTWTVDTVCGADACTQTLEVIDTQPPLVEAFCGRGLLFPARGAMVNVAGDGNAFDNCDPDPSLYLSVWSNEGHGPAPFAPDGALQVETLLLRSDRDIRGPGRVYLVVLRAEDCGGDSPDGFGCCTVVVPKLPSVGWIMSVMADAAEAEAVCAGTAPDSSPGDIPDGYELLLGEISVGEPPVNGQP